MFVNQFFSSTAASEPMLVPVAELQALLDDGAVLIDIRSHRHREQQGTLPGALAIAEEDLVSRCLPVGPSSLALAVDNEVTWVVVGSSELQAVRATQRLHDVGLRSSVAVSGGYVAVVETKLMRTTSRKGHCVRETKAISAH